MFCDVEMGPCIRVGRIGWRCDCGLTKRVRVVSIPVVDYRFA